MRHELQIADIKENKRWPLPAVYQNKSELIKTYTNVDIVYIIPELAIWLFANRYCDSKPKACFHHVNSVIWNKIIIFPTLTHYTDLHQFIRIGSEVINVSTFVSRPDCLANSRLYLSLSTCIALPVWAVVSIPVWVKAGHQVTLTHAMILLWTRELWYQNYLPIIN